jgi:hypothetical protein
MRAYVSPLQSAEGPKDVNKVMARFVWPTEKSRKSWSA